MKFLLYSEHPHTHEKSVTLTAFWVGFIIVMIKIIISDMTIAGKLMPHFSGLDGSMLISALGGLYSLRKYSESKTRNVFVEINPSSLVEAKELIKNISTAFSGWSFKTLSELNIANFESIDKVDSIYTLGNVSDNLLWQKIFVARTALENYKNSGFAKLSVLEVAKEKMFSLYNYKALSDVIAGSRDAQLEFNNNLLSVWKLLGAIAPTGLTEEENVGAYSFEVNKSLQVLKINNSILTSSALLNGFEVKVTSDVVVFTVNISTQVKLSAYSADIYIDLNVLNGAGSTLLLAPITGFAFASQSGWEYAFRINNGKASMYSFNNYSQQLISEFNLTNSFTVSVPIGVLRGTPLSWGYQVVLFKSHEGIVKVMDYISNDAIERVNSIDNLQIVIKSLRLENSR